MKKAHIVSALLIAALAFLVPAQAQAQYVVSNLDSDEVFGLWKTLRKFKKNTSKTHEVNSGGSLVRTKFAVSSCVDLTDPYNEAWHCIANVTGTFKIKNKFHQGVDVGGGSADIVSGAEGDKIKFSEVVDYGWDPVAKLLTVDVTYVADPLALGVVDYVGTYNVKGKTANKVETESKSFDISSSFGSVFGLGVDVSKTENKRISKLLIVISGSGYTAQTGEFVVQKVGGQTIFITGMSWFTEALLDYTEQATLNSTECSGNHKFEIDASFKEVDSSGNFNLGSDSEVQCRITSDQVTAHILWRADPAFTSTQPQGVGQEVFNRIVVQHLSATSHKSFYETGLTSVVNWELDVETVNSSNTGGGFEVASTHTIWNLPKGHAYETTY